MNSIVFHAASNRCISLLSSQQFASSLHTGHVKHVQAAGHQRETSVQSRCLVVDGLSASRVDKKQRVASASHCRRQIYLAPEQEKAHDQQLSTQTTVHNQEDRHGHNETIPRELFPLCKLLHVLNVGNCPIATVTVAKI